MPRNPNDPIPGFEDEFSGTVGKEKRIHRDHFHITDLVSLKGDFDTGYEWVKSGMKWIRVRKPTESARSAARAGGT